MRTLIGADDTLVLWAVIIAGTGAAIWLEQTYRWAARIGAPLLALGLAMVLSNTRIMPMNSPAYDFIGAYLVPLALALLLFRANLFHIVRVSGWMFLVFHISALGTVVGAVIAAFALRGHVPQIERAIGMMTGSYIGGGINFFAVKESINGSEEIGGYMLYVFLFAIGLPADLAAVVWNVPLLFVLCAIIAVTNLAVTLFLGKLFRLELEQLLLCVNATLGGPPTAAAMAISCGWAKLVLPSILVGIWGYVIGASIGILLAEILLRI